MYMEIKSTIAPLFIHDFQFRQQLNGIGLNSPAVLNHHFGGQLLKQLQNPAS